MFCIEFSLTPSGDVSKIYHSKISVAFKLTPSTAVDGGLTPSTAVDGVCRRPRIRTRANACEGVISETLLYFPAAEHHRTLAGTYFPSHSW